jgi:membrane-bound lytic murein transglycosylase D
VSSRTLITLIILFSISTQPIVGQKKRRSRQPPKPVPTSQPSTNKPAASSTPNDLGSTDSRVLPVINRAEEYFQSGQSFLKRGGRKQARDEFDKAIDTILNSGIDVRATPRLQTCYLELVERIYRLEVPQQRVGGFKDQRFEPSPLDDLARLTLTPSEPNVSQEDRAGLEQARNAVDFKFNTNPLIQQFINYYQGRGRPVMETDLRRSGQFIKMARRIFREEGVPEEVTWLAQIESHWNPKYVTPRGAGLWQLPTIKVKEYGLRQSDRVDERMSLERATRASAKYLKALAGRYNGNWELAIAAYNAGEGNIDRAIQRARRADFWAIYPYIAQENRGYLPNVLAIILIAKNPEKYGFSNLSHDAPLSYDVVQVQSATNLYLIADATGTSIDAIRYLNPELLKDTTPQGEAHQVRVPAGRSQALVAVLTLIPQEQRAVLVRAPGEVRENAAKRIAALKAKEAGCQLTLAQAPELRGFRLGMTLAQVKEKITSESYFDRLYTVSEFGERSVRVSGYQLKAENSKGVSDAEFEFLDDKLTLLKVTYDGSVRWNSPQEFVSRVVEALGLPPSDDSRRSAYRLECSGFIVEIDYSSGYMPTIRIYDPEAPRVVAKRRADKEEKKRREFKP